MDVQSCRDGSLLLPMEIVNAFGEQQEFCLHVMAADQPRGWLEQTDSFFMMQVPGNVILVPAARIGLIIFVFTNWGGGGFFKG